MFELRHGRFPTNEEGLAILVENKHGLPKWRQLLLDVPLDPWGKPYQYVIRSKATDASSEEMEFGIYSLGPDRMSATNGNDPDDFNTWEPGKDTIKVKSSTGSNWVVIGWITALTCGVAWSLWRMWPLALARGRELIQHDRR